MDLRPFCKKTNGIADSVNNLELARVVNRLDTTLININSTVAAMPRWGRNSPTKLLNDDSLYTNLNQTLVDLDALLIDMKDQPKKICSLFIIRKKRHKTKK